VTLTRARDAAGRDGEVRSARVSPRAVVVSADPAVRDGWARALEATGMSVRRCVGPAVSCILMEGSDRCPLLDEAGIALYHEPLLVEPFLSRLRASRSSAMVIATRDRYRIDGDHEPSMSHVIARPAA